MHTSIENFLSTLATSNLLQAYQFLDQEHTELTDIEKNLVQQLRIICTSHLIRERQGKLSSLLNIKKSGFNPSLVIDVGAQVGTPELYGAFPNAHHVFIEPVAECIPTLQAISKTLTSCEVLNSAVSNVNGKLTLSLSNTKQYSSIDKDMGGETREIPVCTLDSIYENLLDHNSILLKIDVDGVEVDVLKGAKTLFEKDCVIVIEASLGDEQPRFHKVVEYLTAYDFKVIDIVDPLFRPGDWHLWQVDLVFAKSDSKYWVSHDFY